MGLFRPGDPSTSPQSRRFTNGTASPSGAGVTAGSVNLPIPASLASGSYELRLVSGASGGTLGRIGITAAHTPAATNDSYTTGANRTLTVPAPGVLANDTDADSPTLQATVEANPAHGTLSLQSNGAFTYNPGTSFTGTDSFTYRATDPTSLSSTAALTITVAAAPVAANDAYTVATGGALNVAAPGVLANDTDVDSPSLQAAVVGNPAHGTLSLQPNGAFSYTPNTGFSGPDSFTYRASDQTSESLPATVAITVSVAALGAGPVAANDSYTVNNGSILTVPAPGVLVNDTDPDSPSLQATVVTSPAHGTVALQPDGGFGYSPQASYAGPDSFTYRATDSSGLFSTATVSIAVNAVACGPRPTVRLETTVANGILQATVIASDVDGPTKNQLQELRFAAPVNGRVTLNGQSHTSAFTVTPPAGTARVSFSVQRITPGQPTTVPLTVVDRCGSWPTLVGGGTGAGF